MTGTSPKHWFTLFICAALPAAAAAAGDAMHTAPAQVFSNAIEQGHAPLRALRHSKHTEYSPPAAAWPDPDPDAALIAIIIDDLGQQQAGGLRAVRLPGPVALAFLPFMPHGAAQATLAHRDGKEVLLHLPLQPGDAARRHPLGLDLRSDRGAMATYLTAALASVPYARGINNHQGSLLTEMPEHMNWLMREIRRRPDLYFVDSRTSTRSIAYRMARARAVPAAERQVFLDSERGAAAVHAAFMQLLRTARRDGLALGIGHPYPETFAVLEAELPRLDRYGVTLVAPSALIAAQKRRGGEPYYKQLKFSASLTRPATRTKVPALLAATSAAGR